MDYVTIDDLKVRGIHGCHKYERETAQEFIVTLSVGIDAKPPADSDALADTIDFDALRTIVETAFAAGRRHLIETLAEEIARNILALPQAREARVAIKKPEVWKDAVPGIIITRTRANA